MVARYIPDRGDVVWLDFSPQRGHEQAGLRPALVLSPQDYNQKSELMLACPITTRAKGYPFEVKIKIGKTDGVVLADQVKSLDWQSRKTKFTALASSETVNQTQRAIEILLKG